MNVNFCQSCAMPMDTSNLHGSNADGSENADYCCYCFKNGAFTRDCTMDEMIEFCIPHEVAANPGMTHDESRRRMKEFFPTLKRWKNQEAPFQK